MRNIPRRSMDRIDQEINVSPLIDVVFILLIFFIVSATFVSVPGIEVNRPKVQTATSLQRNSILFALSNENQLFHGGQEIQLDEMPISLTNEVATIKKIKRIKTMSIRGDTLISVCS